MFLDEITNADAMPTLRAMAQFAARRHQVIVGNIANLDTPGYQTRDVSVGDFRQQLAKAVERRRDEFGGSRGELTLESTAEVVQKAGGDIELHAKPRGSGNVLYHDRNDRDLERSLQSLAENVAVFRMATDLLKARSSMIESAIRERI